MPTTCHRVVGVVDVESLPPFAFESQQPLPEPFAATPDCAPVVGLIPTTVIAADVQQLAVDLVVELQRYQRHAC